MKFTVSKENFRLAISKVVNIISSKMTLPALNNILIEADGDTLCLTTSDLELSIKTTVSALVFEGGATTLPAKKLSQIAADLPAGDVTVETAEDETATISCQRSLFKIHGLPASEYQRPEDFQEDWSFSMPAVDLVKNLAKVAYARSDDESRRILNGVLCSVRGGTLTIAATDGRRLALVEKPLAAEGIEDGDIILPTKVTSELSKSLDLTAQVMIRISSSAVAFVTPETTIISKLIEGVYPNYRQVIPESFGQQIALPRLRFLDALKRVALVIQDTASAVKLDLGANQVTISASSQDVGEASEPVDVEYDGPAVTIGLNPTFLVEPLKLLDCDQLTMKFSDELSPVELSGDEGFLYILMPMRG